MGKSKRHEEVVSDDEVSDDGGDRKDEMKKLALEYSANCIKQLPANIRQRVYGLQGLQKDYAELHDEFMKEMKELEKRFENLYAPFYEKRKNIVQGLVEPTEEEISKGSKVMEVKEEGEEEVPSDGPKGIPDFWLTALKNNELVEETIVQRDEACLKFLKDITSKNFEDPNEGFTLTFHFDENPFFNNTELTKTYHLAEEDEILIDKCEGCKIDWKPGQDLTVTVKKKKQRHKGGKNTRVVTKTEPCDSFFNFFSPPKMPDGSDDEEDKDAEDALDELEDRIEHDYELGRTIKDRIIPRAVDWFTGEAITTMEFQVARGAGASSGDEDEEESSQARISGLPKAQPPECKQQ